MHSCPECGQACYCCGDIDDSPSTTDDWVDENCVHCLGRVCGDEEEEG